MFGRKRRSRLDEVVETVEPYAKSARDVVADQEARRRGIAALASLLLLRRRLLATTGIAGLAWRLANDPQLRGQLNQLAGDLVEFKGRAERARARRRAPLPPACGVRPRPAGGRGQSPGAVGWRGSRR